MNSEQDFDKARHSGRALITLNPPLPCTVQPCGPLGGTFGSTHGNSYAPVQVGFVHFLSSDRLGLKLIAPPHGLPTYLESSSRLTVLFDEQKAYHLLCDLVPSPSHVMVPSTSPQSPTSDPSETFLYQVSDQVSRDLLADLLTLVRKSQHIILCATTDVEASDRYTGFSDIILKPMALPEASWDELDTTTSFLKRTFSWPLLITGMTGGLERGSEINRHLALAAAALNIPMGVGSQRVALDNPEHAPIFNVKRYAPGVFLIANLGVAQLAGVSPDLALDRCRRAVDMIEADALAIHVNIMQEVIQVEGDRNFKGVLANLAYIVERLGIPVLVKEVGAGMDVATAKKFANIGVAALDCGGKGGTSWSYIEGLRTTLPMVRAVGETFRDWGIPTAVALSNLVKTNRTNFLGVELVATGGFRDGLAVAKALALGAKICGIGLPLLKAALVDEQEVLNTLKTFGQGLKVAMIGSGARKISDLSSRFACNQRFLELCQLYNDDAQLGDDKR